MLSSLKLVDYFFQIKTGKFVPKTGTRKQYEFDANNRFYRKKKLLAGRFNPKNWYWDGKENKWTYMKNMRKSKKHRYNPNLNFRPARGYESPWMDYTEGKNYLPYGIATYTYPPEGSEGQQGTVTGTDTTGGVEQKNADRPKSPKTNPSAFA